MDDGGFDFNIAIVGLGLIGGSYAMALRELNPQKIYGIDMNEGALKKALELGIIDSGYKNGKEVLKEADLVIIALYPEETIKFIEDNRFSFKSGAVITDTCGIKDKIVEKISESLPESIDFIAAHPMAGKEAKGLDNASKDIFKNANYIITPIKRNNQNNIKMIEKMAKAIGCKNVVCITPEEHDRIISFTSQLPHIIAVSLMYSHLKDNNIELFSGGSFKDATRVAVINSELWSELFMLNSGNLINEIERFEESIKEVKKAIQSEDRYSLVNILEKATEKRGKMV
jgi:prephenate dehydrogenase